VSRQLRLVLGLRADSYRVRTEATAGYDVSPLIVGANPPIDPDALPNPLGDTVSRGALTGDVGAVFRVNDAVNVIGHYGRSYRHANLEELLFAGPATVGTIVPNLLVEPEKGHNVDVGLRVRTSAYAASVTYFNNTFDGFISTEITSTSSVGPISQAINFADVRIQGVEGDGQVPLAFRQGVVTLFGNVAFTRGTVLRGTNPFTGASLDGTPQDNITPFKTIFGARFNDVRDRYWVEYGARAQADVERVATTMIESPYLIAQDLLSLDGFVVQRIAGGVNFQRGANRLGLVFAVENLTDRFYREQFQFAPARGRSFTVGINVKGI
jgi:outer membrane receptor protein involved in Fe transport